MKNTRLRIPIAAFILAAGWIVAEPCRASLPAPLKAPNDKAPLLTAVIEIGPFDIKDLYLSGEGPGRIRDISVGEMVASKKTIWLEPHDPTAPQPSPPSAVPDPGDRLYWSRGATLEILDEHGNALPHPEFLCHSLIAFNGTKHWSYFPNSSGISEGFVYNFSQGITDIPLPGDFGIPLNSNEHLRFEFQTLNRTSHLPRRITCRWTLYFVADKDLVQPIKPLNLFHSGISVLVGDSKSLNRQLGSGCGGILCGLKGMSKGKDAPNDTLHRKLNIPYDKNEKGEEITWHWVIPPGRHSYRTMHPEHDFDSEGPIRAAGAHVHPFCEKISMIEMRPGKPDKVVFTIKSRTDTTPGIRISHIDYLTWPKKGITLDKGAEYGWEVTYNNTSGVDQDSMAGVTLYFSDPKFQKPTWAL